MDTSKLRRPSFISFASLADFDVIVMDEDPDDIMAQAVAASRSHAQLVLADEAGKGMLGAGEELIGGPRDHPGGRQWMAHIESSV